MTNFNKDCPYACGAYACWAVRPLLHTTVEVPPPPFNIDNYHKQIYAPAASWIRYLIIWTYSFPIFFWHETVPLVLIWTEMIIIHHYNTSIIPYRDLCWWASQSRAAGWVRSMSACWPSDRWMQPLSCMYCKKVKGVFQIADLMPGGVWQPKSQRALRRGHRLGVSMYQILK